MSKMRPTRKPKPRPPAAVKRAARKKRSGANTLRPDLRKKLVSAIKNGGKLARGFRRHFNEMSARDVDFGDWPAIQTDLDAWTRKAKKALQRVTSAIDEIAGSRDEGLQADATLVSQLGYTKLLGDICQSLDDQRREARVPLTAEHKRRFSAAIADLVIKARFLSGLANELVNEIASSRPTRAPGIRDPLQNTEETLGQLVEASLKFATSQTSSEVGAGGKRLAASLKAVSDYEVDLDAVKAALLKQADDLKQQKQYEWEQQLRALVEAIRINSTFQLAIISTAEDSLLAAAQPSKAADAAAAKLIDALRTLRSRHAEILVACKAACGTDEGGDDCADPATISAHDDLTPTETVVVDYFRRLVVERGKTSSVRIEEIITSVWPKLKSAGLPNSEGTIRATVKRLSNRSRNILHWQKGGRLSGHGGAKLYRLTFAAAGKFPPWDAPSGDAARSAAPGQGSKSCAARKRGRKASSR